MSGFRLLDNWSPPDGAGDPVAVLATTFTFESDFFTQDCLSRFLSLSTVSSEGDRISTIAAMLEEEDRLTEAQVSVLIDRSSPAEKRNLRWDVLPVSVPGGLLHAKVAVLMWERATRVIIGSANLTTAGYRRQVEVGLAFDLGPDCRVPRSVLVDLSAELRRFIDLVPGPTTGAKGRAAATIDLLDERLGSLRLPESQDRSLRLAVAASRAGSSPLDRLDAVWRGPQPLTATVLSPFWDGTVPSRAIAAIRRRLTGRPAVRRQITAVVSVDPFTGVVSAPPSLGHEHHLDIAAFDPPDTELRALHAKVLLIESDEWLAALIGSSNATEAGYGLHSTRGHEELNLWIGCPARSRTAVQLRALIRLGSALEIGDERWEATPDEDEPTTPVLHEGFVWCTIKLGEQATVSLEFDLDLLPTTWQVQLPVGRLLLTSEDWQASGSRQVVELPLGKEPLPPYLVVRWHQDGDEVQATWPANVEDRSGLPPPSELADLPVELLLAALASSRPLPAALEHELRRRSEGQDIGGQQELDPLRRFDSSGLLLQRTRHLSLALWRLGERLSRPASSIDIVRWRLHGVVGPTAIADGLITAANDDRTLPGEPHFLLAELALTIASVEWGSVGPNLDQDALRHEVDEVLNAIDRRRCELPPAPDERLSRYVQDAFAEALR